MPEVELFGGLRDAANGAESVRVDGATIHELLQNLARKYPTMRERVDQGVAVTETTGNSRYPRARKSFY